MNQGTVYLQCWRTSASQSSSPVTTSMENGNIVWLTTTCSNFVQVVPLIFFFFFRGNLTDIRDHHALADVFFALAALSHGFCVYYKDVVCFRHPFRNGAPPVTATGGLHRRHKVLQRALGSQGAFTLSAAKLIQFVPKVDFHCLGHCVLDLDQHYRRRRTSALLLRPQAGHATVDHDGHIGRGKARGFSGDRCGNRLLGGHEGNVLGINCAQVGISLHGFPTRHSTRLSAESSFRSLRSIKSTAPTHC
jgi:hypothetical protein